MSSDILVPAGGSQSTISVGVMLSNERVKRGISLQEVADQLKLSRKQIEALENDDFDRLPGVAFVRGFTRNYAKFLGLDPTPLMLALDVVLPARTPPIVAAVESAPASDKEPSSPAAAKKKSPVLMIGAAVLGMVGLFGVYTTAKREPNTPSPLSASPAKSEAVVPAAPVASTATDKAAPVAAAPVEPVLVAKPETIVTPEPAVPATIASQPVAQVSLPANSANVVGLMAENEIRLKVTQNSWLSVVDGSGKKLLYGEIAPGEERKLSGQPPFKLTIGNASGVSLLYKGQPIDLAPSTKGATARLVLK